LLTSNKSNFELGLLDRTFEGEQLCSFSILSVLGEK
jgi:hypothetical protein